MAATRVLKTFFDVWSQSINDRTKRPPPSTRPTDPSDFERWKNWKEAQWKHKDPPGSGDGGDGGMDEDSGAGLGNWNIDPNSWADELERPFRGKFCAASKTTSLCSTKRSMARHPYTPTLDGTRCSR